MEAFNEAHLAKKLCNVVNHPHSLLAKLVVQKYGKGVVQNITSKYSNSS